MTADAQSCPICPHGCGKPLGQHDRWDDDPLPPMPAVEVNGHLFIEAGLCRELIEDVRAAIRRFHSGGSA
jgi:hypothetical protein